MNHLTIDRNFPLIVFQYFKVIITHVIFPLQMDGSFNTSLGYNFRKLSCSILIDELEEFLEPIDFLFFALSVCPILVVLDEI